MSAALLLAAALLGATPAKDETEQRCDALISQGFNLTHSWSLDARPVKTTVRLEVFVPRAGEHAFSFWAEAPRGEFSFRLLGPDGQVRSAWSGRKGESTISFEAPTGKYVVEIDRAADTGGHALFAVKGGAMRQCESSAQEHPAAPAKGFHWPYLLYLPKEAHGHRLLVAPNNTGFVTDDLELLRTAASCEVRRQTALADRLGAPLLIPLFPRPPTVDETENLYLHALTRSSLETKVEAYRRVDLQLLAMIDDARAALPEVKPEVLLWGFSASGSFVNRFAMLHPERVAAVACGSPGGWPIAPVAHLGADTLGYPVGIADVEVLAGQPVDLAALKRVAWFFFLGAEDQNDAVPFRDSFSKADETLLFRRFGKTPVARWKEAEQLYRRAGLNARFKLYPGTGHQVTPEMEKDVAGAFEKLEKLEK